MGKTYKFSRYVEEAKAEAFALEIGDGELLEIPVPDGDTVLEIEESASSRRRLELLCGEHYERVRELVGGAPSSVLNSLVADMASHFGLTPEPPGGSRASSR